MDEMCMNYRKVIFKSFFHIVCVPKNILVLWVTSERFISKEKIKNLRNNGSTNEELKKEWENGINGLDGRCRDLLLQEHCKKLFNLIDTFWCHIKYAEVDANWLLKVKTYLDKLEKIQSKIKRKKLKNMSTNSLLKDRFPFGEMSGDFAAKFIWACAFLFVYSLAGEIFLFKVVKMDLTNSRSRQNCLTNQNANTFQSYLFQQIHFNQIKSKVAANNMSNIHLQMFFQIYAIAAE